MIESLEKQADQENSSKQVTGGLFDYYGIVAKEKKIKINFEEFLIHNFYQ